MSDEMLMTASEIARKLDCNEHTVRRWRLPPRGLRLVRLEFDGLRRDCPVNVYSLEDARERALGCPKIGKRQQEKGNE